MSSTLIRGAEAVLTGLDGVAARSPACDIRIEGELIVAMGELEPLAGELVVDASHCVAYPGFVNTHHHLFQSMLKGVPAGLNVPLFEWLQAVPYRFGPYMDEATLEVAATIGMTELLLSGCTTVADHHYLYGQGMAYDPTEVLFQVAERLGLRLDPPKLDEHGTELLLSLGYSGDEVAALRRDGILLPVQPGSVS